jgi:hypothetical protein
VRIGVLLLITLPNVVWSFAAGGLDLTPTQLIQTGWRGRSFDWSRIQDVVVDRDGRRIQVWTDDGRVRRLRAPRRPSRHWPGRRFDQDYDVLGQWWVEHRGADWRPWPTLPSPSQLSPDEPSVAGSPGAYPGWADPR